MGISRGDAALILKHFERARDAKEHEQRLQALDSAFELLGACGFEIADIFEAAIAPPWGDDPLGGVP